MLTRICLSLALLVAMPGWSQVEPSATGPPPSSQDAMQTPPPVSGEAYPTATGSEARSNYLRAGFSLTTAYLDNVLAGEGNPVSDVIYTIAPTFTLDQSTARTHRSLNYSPGFTFYQPTSVMNAMNQNATVGFHYRLSPHATISLHESFAQTSNVFDQPYGGVSGSTQAPTNAVVAPSAEERTNAAGGEISYQFSSNGMIGGSGTFSMLSYPNPAQDQGLASNSNSLAGSGFYNLRLSSAQYTGMTYQYSRMTASLANAPSDTQTHTIYFFYTLYLSHTLSLSVSGGPQHFVVVEAPLAASAAWTPALSASMGWQRNRTNLAASYSRTVSGAGGLVGAFESESGNANAGWQFARTWSAGLAAGYTSQNNVIPAVISSSQGGHSISGSFSVQHPIGEHFSAGFGYSRIHQSYGGIAGISQNPNSDRGYVSISYQLSRPLGR